MNPAIVVFDGECPLCRGFVERLEPAAGQSFEYVDARSDAPIVDELKARGVDLDGGMVLRLDGNDYQGDRAVQMLAVLAKARGPLQRWMRWWLRSPRRAGASYPLLKAVRRALLSARGIGPIGSHRPPSGGDRD